MVRAVLLPAGPKQITATLARAVQQKGVSSTLSVWVFLQTPLHRSGLAAGQVHWPCTQVCVETHLAPPLVAQPPQLFCRAGENERVWLVWGLAFLHCWLAQSGGAAHRQELDHCTERTGSTRPQVLPYRWRCRCTSFRRRTSGLHTQQRGCAQLVAAAPCSCYRTALADRGC